MIRPGESWSTTAHLFRKSNIFAREAVVLRRLKTSRSKRPTFPLWRSSMTIVLPIEAGWLRLIGALLPSMVSMQSPGAYYRCGLWAKNGLLSHHVRARYAVTLRVGL